MKVLYADGDVMMKQIELNTTYVYTVYAPGMPMAERYDNFNEALDRYEELIHA